MSFQIGFKQFLSRSLVPGAAFLGAGLSGCGVYYNLPWLTVIGAIIAAIAALTAAVWQSEWSEKIEHQGRVITDQALRIEALVTGGDGYAYLSFSATQSLNTFSLIAVNGSNYPLYEVQARIVDATASLNATSLLQVLSNDIHIALGNFPPKAARLTSNQLTLPATASAQDYNVFFSGRNGFWTQLNRFRKTSKGEWVEAFRVTGVSGKVVHESIHAQYPLNASGLVDW